MIITISREFGSGGHSIGMKVAEKLGIPFYDNEIVDKVAEKSGYSEDYIKEKGEYISKKAAYFNLSIPYPGCFEDPRDRVFAIQREVILEAARAGDCVIVGRCADYILKEEKIQALDVFIYSDTASREARILEKYGKTEVDIKKRISQKDKQRKSYFRYYTEEEWGDYHNYNLCLDSGFLGEDRCVEYIISAAESRK